jgi:Fe-S oxidoreductase
MKPSDVDFSFDGYSALGLTVGPKNDRIRRFLQAMKASVDKKENWPFWLPYALSRDLCVKCGTCAELCPIYLSSGRNRKYRPTYRSDMLRRVYKRYFTLSGKIFRGLVGAEELDEQKLNQMAESFYRCTVCRRCALGCPLAIDNALITREGRKMFDAIGIAPKELKESGTDLQLKMGNATGTPKEAFLGMIEFMEDDIWQRRGKRIKFPVDKKGAEMLVMHNAGDYLSFMEDVMGIAEVLDAAGANWTINTVDTGLNDVVNYGAWFSDERLTKIMAKHFETARDLDAKAIVVGECGHAYKALKILSERLFPRKGRVEVKSILQVTDRYITEGKIKLNPEANSEPVTYHDSCNLGRMGGLYEEPRRILRASCKDFREMSPNRELNYCCGGGSGFAIMSKYNFLDFRMKVAGKMKVDQIKATDAKKVVSVCSNCKAQLRELIQYYGLDKQDVAFSGLHELVANALVS